MKKKTSKQVAFAAIAILIAGTSAMNGIHATTQTATTTRPGSTTGQSDEDYGNWKSNQWTGKEDGAFNSGRLMLTPGKTQKDINMAWYAKQAGEPVVKLAMRSDMSDATIYAGISTSINKTNGQNTYLASNKVSIDGALKEGTTYYYQYSDDKNGTFSAIYSFKTAASFQSYNAILVGDPQIGASGSSGQSTLDDKNIALDTYNWNKTLTTATTMVPNASFILSAGDQIDYSTASGYDIREREYAGFTYPSVLRSYPLAATIGNHESMGDDYQYHYNTPNASKLGATTSGGDYYYRYGNTLYVVLNTNNRNAAEHDQLMQEAITSHADAKWKVVMFHHDIYGSASSHSDIDGANLRILFAPLMDKYDIDVCLTGHDHQYARTYQIIDGKVVDYDDHGALVSNPEGTMYITAGSASGSKYYSLNKVAQYYLAERVSDNTPSFSKISVDDTSLKIETFDYNGNSYANPFTIHKGEDATSVSTMLQELSAYDKDTFTKGSTKRIDDAVKNVATLLDMRNDREIVQKLSDEYLQDPNTGSLNYYGYDSITGGALAKGVSKLLDKTLYENDTNTAISASDMTTVKNSLQVAMDQKITLNEVEAVKQTLTSMEATLQAAREGVQKGEYPVGAKTTLKTVLDHATKELAKEDLTKNEMNKISANIQEAFTAFQNARNTSDAPTNTPTTPAAPMGKAPNTGDSSNLLLVAASAILSFFGIVAVFLHKRKQIFTLRNK